MMPDAWMRATPPYRKTPPEGPSARTVVILILVLALVIAANLLRETVL